jgi:hypothetical protein
VRLSVDLLVEEIDDHGHQVAEAVNRGKTNVARFGDQADLEQYLPVMLDRLSDEICNLATVHPRRGTPEERASAARRGLLHKIAAALDLPPHLLIRDPYEDLTDPGKHYPLRASICPIDGQPLRAMTARANAPSTYEHTDGTAHDDLLNTIQEPREDHP